MKKSQLCVILAELNEIRRRFGHIRLYRLYPEWGSDGVWAPRLIGSIALGGCIDIGDFPVSNELKERLRKWHDVFEAEIPEQLWKVPGMRARFEAEGVNLAVDASRELQDGAVVEYKIGNDAVLFKAGRCVAAYPLDPTTSGHWKGTDD